jgi:hypothetical protein
MKKKPSANGRSVAALHRLQKHWTRTLREQTEKLLGPMPKNLANYESRFLRSFKTSSRRFKASHKEILFQSLLDSNVTLIGDFHSDPQSQRLFLRLLRSMPKAELEKTAVAFEMFSTSQDRLLSRFQRGTLSPDALLKKTGYAEHWGFSTRNVLPLLEFIQEKHVSVFGVNRPKHHLPREAILKSHRKNEDLGARDEWAAARILELLSTGGHTGKKFDRVIVLIGELHLADAHLPAAIERLNETSWVKRLKVLRIFQNQDSLYWRAIENTNPTEQSIFQLSSKDFCIFSSTPWNKARSYYHWLLGDPEQENELEFGELARSQMRPLVKLFSLPEIEWDHFEWEQMDVDRALFWSGDWMWKEGAFYISNPSENIAIEVGAVYTLLQMRRFRGSQLTIADKIVLRAFGQFCSILLNPKRKIEFPSDHVKRSKALEKHAAHIRYPHEKWSRRLYLSWHEKESMPFSLSKQFQAIPKNLREASVETFCRYAAAEMAQTLIQLFYDKKFHLQDLLKLFEMGMIDHGNKVIQTHFKGNSRKRIAKRTKEDLL